MIDEYLMDSIKIKTSTLDEWGEPGEVTTVTVKGRFEYKTQLVRNVYGEEVVSSGFIYLKDKALSHEATLEYDGDDFAIVTIHHERDFDNKFLKVYVK